MAEKLDIEDTSVLKRNAEIIANRMLHSAIEELKKTAGTPEQQAVHSAVLRIFGVEEENV